MKNRKPPKQRCLVTKAMRESKIFAPKTIPNKKGKGVIYNRAKQDRSDLSGPFLLSRIKRWRDAAPGPRSDWPRTLLPACVF